MDGEFAIYFPTVADWQIICMHCLLSGAGKPDEFAELTVLMNPYTNAQCCIFNVLYCLCNIISVLGPFFSVLVSLLSVNSIL